MSDVPMEIETDILRRLPVKPLLRFRSVSKPWCALIDSPDFVKSHLNRNLQDNTNCKIVLTDSYLYSVDFGSLDTAVKLAHPVSRELDGRRTEILGSCHGLLCLYDGLDDIVLWNPSTRRHKKLPATEIEFPDSVFPCTQFVIYGFGHDQVNDDYKVVRLVQFYGDDDDSFHSEVKVYSSNSNSWRRIEDFPYCFHYKRDYGMLASGALHSVVSRKPESDIANLIVAFDFATEEYRLVPQPEYAEKGFHMNVGVLGDRLCVNCNYYPHYFDIWIMMEYEVKESWTKLLSIAQPYDIRSFEFLKPIAYSKSGVQVLMEMSKRPKNRSDTGSFFWYDLEKKSVKLLEIHGGPPNFFDTYVCVESLVQLKGGGMQDVKSQPAQGKRKKRKLRRGMIFCRRGSNLCYKQWREISRI